MFVEEKKHGEAVVDEIGCLMLRAADYMDKHGISKWVAESPQGQVCWGGALMKVYQGDAWIWDYDILGKVANRMGCSTYIKPMNWNNHPHTTKQMVVDALRSAAYKG